MAGIPGQPGTKPSSVKSPIPTEAAAASAFDSYEPPESSAFDNYDPNGQTPAAEVAPEGQGYQGPGRGALEATAEWAPTVLGIGGGAVGMAAGPLGSAAGAGAGALAGMGYRQFIEEELLGKPRKDPEQALREAGLEAGKTVAEQLAGETALKVAGKVGKLAMKTQVGQAISDKVMKAAAPAVQYINDFTDNVKKGIMGPVTDFLEKNSSPMNIEQSGNQIKERFTSLIGDKFNQFKQSYGKLNEVVGDIPMADADKLKLTGTLRADARGFQGSIYGKVKSYATRIDDATNSQQIHTVLSDVGQEIERLKPHATSGAVRDQIAALQSFRDRASDFMEDFTHGIAKRVANGKATMDEMAAFEKMAIAQANPTVAATPGNLRKYAQSVAKDYSDDYISKRAAIDADYAKFRNFLEDVGEQTRVGAQKKGPGQFMRSVTDVPSEQLVERMFLPKNAAALREMQKTTPEIFEMVKQARIRDIVNKSKDGDVLNLRKFADNLDNNQILPESSRSLIISDADRKMIRAIANSSNVKSIDRMAKNITANLVVDIIDITRMSTLAGAKILKDSGAAASKGAQKVMANPAGNVAVKQGVGAALGAGRAVQGLSDTYFPNSPAGGQQ